MVAAINPKTSNHILKVTLYLVTLFAAVYVITTAVIFKQPPCADAQCSMVPHFEFSTYIGVVTQGHSSYTHTSPTDCTPKNCVCSFTYIRIMEPHGGSAAACRVEPSGNSWNLITAADYTNEVQCSFRCLKW